MKWSGDDIRIRFLPEETCPRALHHSAQCRLEPDWNDSVQRRKAVGRIFILDAEQSVANVACFREREFFVEIDACDCRKCKHFQGRTKKSSSKKAAQETCSTLATDC